MKNTKELILLTALELFAKEGYEGVSMSAISGKIGITKAALYKHYESKQAIFDSIVERMKEKNMEHTKKFDIPVGSFETASNSDKELNFEKIKKFSLDMFRYWTKDSFASSFRKVLTLEQYRNPKMAKLLNEYLTGGIIGNAKDLIKEASNSDKDSQVLALEYFAPIYMMMNLYDQMEDKENAMTLVKKHIDYFMANLMK
ncbi:MAG: TetR/AcrR family transcriptional regulator [Clostridioides sp.]|nr:TetR/AcrR family transcriptional regulator [Clostridioides sp.]